MFGEEIRIPLDVILGTERQETPTTAHVTELQTRLETAYRRVRDNDEVSKFHQRWKGPYRVLDRVTEVNYKVIPTQGATRRKKVVHVNNMKAYVVREEGIKPTEKPNGGARDLRTRKKQQIPNTDNRAQGTRPSRNGRRFRIRRRG
jgi:hypothetical protein